MDVIADIRKELETSGLLRLQVKVIPRSSRTEIAGRMADGSIKIKVAAVPEKGRANAALCAYLAELCGVPKGNVTVEAGLTSQRKKVRVVGPGAL